MVYLNKQLCTIPSFAVDFLMMLNFCSTQLLISISRPRVAGSVVSSKQKQQAFMSERMGYAFTIAFMALNCHIKLKLLFIDLTKIITLNKNPYFQFRCIVDHFGETEFHQKLLSTFIRC